jgi:DNA polymerase III epsilon subunit-like protein
MIIIDIETSGINPIKNSILSIGAVDFSNSQNQFYGECRWEGGEIDPRALNVNGFTLENITSSKKKNLKEILLDFQTWMDPIEDQTFGGHNLGAFDIPFLINSLKRKNLLQYFNFNGENPKFGKRTVDLHSEVYSSHLKRGIEIPLKHKMSYLNSTNALVYTGLPKEPMPHNALTGAKMEAEALSRLICGKNLLEEYKKYEIPKYLLENKKEEKKPIDLNYRLSLFLKNKN